MVFEAPGALHQIRVSPDGRLVAFQEVSQGLAAVAVVDKQKQKKTLSEGWLQVGGIAWTRSGDELWLAGARKDTGWGLFGLTLTGKLRLLLRMPGQARLEDVAPDGRALLTLETPQTGIRYFAQDATEETDLSWLDRSTLDDLSRDGRLLLFSERGEAGGAEGAVYLRKTDGSPAVKLGAGTGVALSPDGKWAMTISRSLLDMHLLPTGAGTPVRMKGTFARYESGEWLPDGKQIVFIAMEAQHDPRIYVQDLSGDPRAISPEGLISGALVSPDGGHIAAVISGKGYLLSTSGVNPQPLMGVAAADVPLAWSADGRSVFVRTGEDIAANVSRVELANGTRTPWKTLIPSDPAGITGVRNVRIRADGRSYAYSYNRLLSELYLVDGLR
jgi:hypothetical protein